MKRQSSLEPTSTLQQASGSRRKSLEDAPVASKFKASSFGQMLDAVKTEAQLHHLWNEDMHRDLPKKWEKHGDLVILPHTCFQHPNWRMLGRRLWQIVAESLQTARLGRKRRIGDDEFRSPHIDLLYGAHGWVEHLDNGVRYQYDVTQCMYSIQNASEKARISEFDCHQETVVDFFAGIGYYTLPYLIHAGAKHVIAIDWNPDAIEALNRNLEANGLTSRCTVIEGDCRKVCPSGVADRVNMGLLPTSKQHWLTGCKALKATGGILHAHDTLPNAKVQEKKGKVEPERVKRRERLVQLQNGSSSLGSVSEESESADLPKGTSIPKVNGKGDACSVKVTNGIIKANGEQKATVVATEKVDAKVVSQSPKIAKGTNGEHISTDAAVITELLAKLTEQVANESISSTTGTIQDGSAASCGDISEATGELNENGEKKRKFSRSASVLEEFEALLIPNPKIEKTFRKEKWSSLDQSWRDLCIEFATSCCKYLNNMHFEKGKVWTCTVLRIGKVKPYSADIDHVVIDLECRPVSDKLAFDDQDVE